MKTCTKCKKHLPLVDYFVKESKTGRLHAQCKLCYKVHRKTYQKNHYEKYKAAYIARAKISREKIRQELHKNMLDYLGDKSCEICGIEDIRVLEFDHIDPSTKEFSISRAISDSKKWGGILEELEKCQILCANCHKIRTAEQYSWYKHSHQK